MTAKTKAHEELADEIARRDRSQDRWDRAPELRALEDLARQRISLDEAILEQVQRARDAGHSWLSIGMMLGISKQGAQQRYGR